MKGRVPFYMLLAMAYFAGFGQAGYQAGTGMANPEKDSCSFKTSGRNIYFILEPGYQLILEDKERKKSLVITVLNATRKISDVQTRVVEERETTRGELTEVSRNFFAYCPESETIFYFGEEVDIYKKGKIVNHEGSWMAEGNNKPGIIMPGKIRLGATYSQEQAPRVAMDRAEIVGLEESVETPAGKFVRCLRVMETTPLDAREKEYKYYAPGVGLIKDEKLLLVKYGFVK